MVSESPTSERDIMRLHYENSAKVLSTNFDPDRYTSPVAGPVDRSGLSKAQTLGVTCGRWAGCDQELWQALKANGLEPGTPEFEEASKAGREAMRLTALSRDWDREDGLD
jgi:hypothetical protein